jgi:ferredoxin-NADP reductase
VKTETQVKEIIQRTYNVVSVRFPRPETLNYKAGQFFFVSLRDGGKEVKRHFSFSSSPTEPDHVEFTKKLSESDFSNALRNLKQNDVASIEAPFGQFTFEGEYEKIGLLGGGIGITPFVSIIKYATDLRLKTHIILLYGNRSESDIAFRKELEDMQAQNQNLKVIFTLNETSKSWTGLSGFISQDMVKKEIPDYKERVFYTCGPPAMVQTMEKLVSDLNLPKTQLKVEYFTGYT